MVRIRRKEKEEKAKVQKVYKLRDDTTGLYWRSYTGWAKSYRWHKVGTLFTHLSHLMNSVSMTGDMSWRGLHFEPYHDYTIVTFELSEVDEETVEIA